MKQYLVALLVVVMLVTGCAAPATATPVAQRQAPTEMPPVVSVETPVSDPSATPAKAVALPTAPQQPYPPVVLSRYPAEGQELKVDDSLLIQFDQAMDPESVADAWSLRPETPGELSWDDPATLRFAPDAPFERDTRYTVELEAFAASAEGIFMSAPVSLAFRTVGLLDVVNVFPAPDSQDVTTEMPVIRMVFNRPVAPLTGIADGEGLSPGLSIVPEIPGKGSWTSTSVYTFVPAQALQAATTYTATIAAGLGDSTGGILAEDYVWHFGTSAPRIESVSPAAGERYAPANAGVMVVFNQAMDRPRTEHAFTLRGANNDTEVAGRFAWDGAVMTFQPDNVLLPGQSYVASVTSEAAAQGGQVVLAREKKWEFRVAPLPAVSRITPADGAVGIEQGEQIELRFTSPISRATLLDGLVITPSLQFYPYWQNQDTVVELSAWLRSSTQYTLTVGEGLLGRDGTPVTRTKQVSFVTGPAEPLLSLNVPGQVGTYNAYTTPLLSLAARNLDAVDLTLYELTRDDLIGLEGEDSWQRWEAFQPAASQRLRRWSLPVSADIDATVYLTTTLGAGDTLAPGIYFVEATASGIKRARRHLLVVSPLNLMLKVGGENLLVWATDLSSGEAVPGLPLTLYDGSGRPVAEATTDQDGVAITKAPTQDPWQPLIVLSDDDARLGAVARNWMSGIEPYAFDFPTGFGPQEHVGYFYTDRRIYRPGQTVHLKGIVRRDLDARYALLDEGSKVQLAVYDPEDRLVLEKTLSLSEMGTLNVDVPLGSEAALGYYRVQAQLGEPQSGKVLEGQTFYADFQVAAYRKPAFSLDVAADQPEILDGDELYAVASADYFSGGAVPEAQVTWRVLSSPWIFDRWDGPGYWSWTDWDMDGLPQIYYGGEMLIAEGRGTTDKAGRFELDFVADLTDKSQSQLYTVEVSVADKTFQEVSARTTVVVHRAEVYLGLSARNYVGTAGERQTVDVLALDSQGQPLASQSVTVVFNQHAWYSVNQEADDGNYYWTNAIRDTPLVTQTVTTDSKGRAEAWFTPDEGGTYKVVALGEDDAGREARSALYLWVSGAGYINWGRENNDRVDLVPDKKAYSPGDVAQILIPSPFDGPVQALLTIERGDILEHRLLTLESNSEQLSLPITADHAPNVFVSVIMVQGMHEGSTSLGDNLVGASRLPSLKLGYAALPVSTEQQQLDITVTSDAEVYQPGDVASYTIRTKDYQGRGVPAEVSLQLVDLAVESLTGYQQPQIVERFYSERGLGVATAATLALSVDRLTLEVSEEGKGGGGGDMAKEGGVRTEFADTAFWEPALQTDANGMAQVEVVLPDNLTTWRMTAQGVTRDTRVGAVQQDVASSLALLVRPIAPRFLLAGDKPQLGALVQNNTATDQQVTVSLSAKGIAIGGRADREVTVASGGTARVMWQAVADVTTEMATLRYEVVAGDLRDATQITLPIHPASYVEVVGTSGSVQDSLTEVVLLPKGASRTQGQLDLTVEPSLTAAMIPGLDYLRAYPYECVEQTVSRFLPNVAVAQAMARMQVSSPLVQTELAQQVGVALQRLNTLQNLDGGWGWWGHHDSRPELTAYVVHGLAQARDAGYAVDERVLDRGVSYLYRWLEKDPTDQQADRDLRAIVLYALAVSGEGDLGRAVSLYEADGPMSLYAKAYLAMTLQMLDPDATVRTQTLVNELMDQMILSASGGHWEEVERSGWAMNTDTRTTALALKALVAITPENELLPQVVRWLMAARASGRWETTQETAWSILALADYAEASGDLEADYDWSVFVNDALLADGSVDADSLAEPTKLDVLVEDMYADGANLVQLLRSDDSAGKLYYSAFLSYYLPAENVEPLDRGLIVRREYSLVDGGGRKVSQATAGDIIEVTLTLIAPHDAYYLVLEDPLPAGCEAIDTSLDTSRMDVPAPLLERDMDEIAVKEAQRLYWEWHYRWPSHTEMHDDKVALFTSELPRGTYEYHYQMRCTTPGEFQVLPSVAFEMYAPDVFGRSAGDRLYIGGAN